MVATKQKPIVGTENTKRKQSKYASTENHQIRKEKAREEKWNRITKQLENKQNGNKYIPIKNYFKYISSKYSNQKT